MSNKRTRSTRHSSTKNNNTKILILGVVVLFVMWYLPEIRYLMGQRLASLVTFVSAAAVVFATAAMFTKQTITDFISNLLNDLMALLRSFGERIKAFIIKNEAEAEEAEEPVKPIKAIKPTPRPVATEPMSSTTQRKSPFVLEPEVPEEDDEVEAEYPTTEPLNCIALPEELANIAIPDGMEWTYGEDGWMLQEKPIIPKPIAILPKGYEYVLKDGKWAVEASPKRKAQVIPEAPVVPEIPVQQKPKVPAKPRTSKPRTTKSTEVTPPPVRPDTDKPTTTTTRRRRSTNAE